MKKLSPTEVTVKITPGYKIAINLDGHTTIYIDAVKAIDIGNAIREAGQKVLKYPSLTGKDKQS